MFRAYQTTLDSSGKGIVYIDPTNAAMEWDIVRISIETGLFVTACQAEIDMNGIMVTSTPQGSKDTATGPPDIIALPGEHITVSWTNGSPGDIATVGVWYNENPVGTTISTSH